MDNLDKIFEDFDWDELEEITECDHKWISCGNRGISWVINGIRHSKITHYSFRCLLCNKNEDRSIYE